MGSDGPYGGGSRGGSMAMNDSRFPQQNPVPGGAVGRGDDSSHSGSVAGPLSDVRWEPDIPNTAWMRRQIVEHMPEPLSPLFEDLYLKRGLDQTMHELVISLEEVGSTDFDIDAILPQGYACTINGYAYTAASFDMDWTNAWAILKVYLHGPRFFRMPAFDWDGVVLPKYQELIARWQAIDLTAAPDETLLQGIREMAAGDSAYWFGSAMHLALSRIMDTVFDRFLKSRLIRFQLPEPRAASASFLKGLDSIALDAQADLEGIANLIRSSPTLTKLVADTPADQLLPAFAEDVDGQLVLDDISRYFDLYGHQIYNLDFVAPTQREDPLPMLLSLKALVDNPPAMDVRSRQAQMVAEREALVGQTVHALDPLSRRIFRQLWEWAKKYAPYREGVIFYMGAAWPAVRKLAAELGRRLTAAGTLRQAEDIYYLDSHEIAQAIDARAKGQGIPAYGQLAQERRALRESRKQLTPPAKIPETSRIKLGPVDLSMFDPTPGDVANDGPVLTGYAVSMGQVTASASVIRSSADFEQMKPGTVLVCTTTTPAWTPLFAQAAGLVTDVGGALAHGSVVAREYGIPAVMGTGNATARIRSGQMLRVDGDAGTVTLVDEAGAPASGQAAAGGAAPRISKGTWRALAAAGVVLVLWWARRRRRKRRAARRMTE